MAEDCIIAENVDVEIWNSCAVFCRVREVNLRLESQASIAGIDDLYISDRLV